MAIGDTAKRLGMGQGLGGIGGTAQTLGMTASGGITNPLQSVLRSNLTMQQRLTAGGVEDEPGESFWRKYIARPVGQVFDVLSRPQYGVMNVARELNRPETFGTASPELGQAFMAGLTGKEKGTGSKLLEELGVQNKYGKAIGGFALDVLADPITYLTLGTGGVAKKTLASAVKKGVSKEFGRDITLESAARLAANPPIGRLGSVVQQAVRETAPQRTLRLGTGLPFTRAQVGVDIPLGRAGEVAGKALGKVGELPGIRTGVQVGKAVREKVGKALVPGFEFDPRLNEVGRRYKDLVRMDSRDIFEEAQKLAKAAPRGDEAWEIAKALDTGDFSKLSDAHKGIAGTLRTTMQGIAEEEQRRGILAAAMENYWPHIFTGAPKDRVLNALAERAARVKGRYGTKVAFAKQRVFQTIDEAETWAKSHGFGVEKDLAKVLAIRKLASQKAIRNYDMLAELRNLGPDLVQPLKGAPSGWVETGLSGLKGMAVHPEAARWLQEFKEPFTNIQSLQETIGTFDKLQNIWKGLATAPRPGFHIRNAFGNFWNNWLGGVKTADAYLHAASIQRNKAGKIALGSGKEMNYQAVRQLARERGVIGQGFFGADIPEMIADIGKRGVRPIVAGRRVGTAIEENARLAHFVDRLIKGEAPDAAAQSVKKYLFDYDELTPTERNILKRALPFYTWARKNIPLQFSELLKQPGTFAKVADFKWAVETLSEGPDDELIPDWLKEMYAVRLPFQVGGKTWLAGIDMPYLDLRAPDPNEVFGMLSPLLKVPIEQIANLNFFLGRPIEKVPGEVVKAPGYLWGFDQAAKQAPGPVRQQWEAFRQRFNVVEVDNEKTGERELRMPARWVHLLDQIVALRDVGRVLELVGGRAGLEQVASPLLGATLRPIDEEKGRLNQAYEQNRRLRDLITLLQSMGTELPEARPRKATLGSGGIGATARLLGGR